MKTDIVTVEIPANVRDNSETVTDYAFMHHLFKDGGVRSPALRDRSLRIYREYLAPCYVVYTWYDVNPDGQRCRFDMVIREITGLVVDLYHTEYFTRVACITHPHHYADRYASVTDQDGVSTTPSPYCGGCMAHLRRSARDSGMMLHESEPLRIGQH